MNKEDIKFQEINSAGITRWVSEYKKLIPCTEEEREIYRVEFKSDNSIYGSRKIFIYQSKFSDCEEIFYEVGHHAYIGFTKPYYKSLEKAKEAVREFLIKKDQGYLNYGNYNKQQ